jgi:hypothetical protein
MAIVYTADVFCDGEDCSEWTHGATLTTPPKKGRARSNAERDGFKYLNGKDYCHRCYKRIIGAES